MMPQPVATPSQVYYKQNTGFMILIWIANVLCGLGVFWSIFLAITTGYLLDGFAEGVFIILWNISILRRKDYFFTGNLTMKCIGWLIIALIDLVIGILSVMIWNPDKGKVMIWNSFVFTVIFLCYRFWSFFRPYKQVQQMPVYIVQQPGMMGSPMMMQQPSPMMMQQPGMMMQQPGMMMQQPSPMMMQQPSPMMMPQPPPQYEHQQYHAPQKN